ncbi:hypothetical protein NKK48_01480 [Mesorhizobium sp. C386A]|uniref:2OG-Fe(II) oxygenase family protein n=1 Tax=unclassified Mesorhizobium TaxID=325217 RepID=UPI0003CDE607|nr:2OG-Fe(II) oxygenase family protein [Mesorhizobium sp. LNJC386A00]ESY35754.1 hypothetical protein X748_14165 [Mesorhizobium sp. LNJC386A00]
MAKLNIILGIAELQANSAGMKPIMSDNIVDGETIDVTTVSDQPSITCLKPDQVWMLTAIDNPVWVKFGRNPSAVVGDSILLMPGIPYSFSATPGFTLAAIKE